MFFRSRPRPVAAHVEQVSARIHARIESGMKRWKSVTIVGVGLIGASIGLALRERGISDRVVGVGRRATTLRKARQRGAVTATTTNLAQGVRDAELIVICTPIEQVVSHGSEAARHCPEGAVITDVASTKATIVQSLEHELAANRRVSFVGSHPMAGSEKAGPDHARADLFQGRVAIITPSRRTRPAAREVVEDFWRQLGAIPIQMTPADHDRAVATVSHLPHLLASALAAATPADDLPLAATGWLDTTRVAGGDPELWRQILSDNRDAVLKALGKFEKVLAAFRAALERNDRRQLVDLLEAGKQRRDALGN